VIFNLLDGEFDDAEERPGFVHRRHSIRGGRRLGATLYEAPPGERLWPYHWEQGCEEFAIVVSGAPTLRAPDGERTLAPGDVVHFQEGADGTHQFRNDTGEPFRLLIGSTKSRLYVAGYPDSGKVMISTPGAPGLMLRDAPELDYWDGE
jgi:uncharacterized cupin superfamily protein